MPHGQRTVSVCRTIALDEQTRIIEVGSAQFRLRPRLGRDVNGLLKMPLRCIPLAVQCRADPESARYRRDPTARKHHALLDNRSKRCVRQRGHRFRGRHLADVREGTEGREGIRLGQANAL